MFTHLSLYIWNKQLLGGMRTILHNPTSLFHSINIFRIPARCQVQVTVLTQGTGMHLAGPWPLHFFQTCRQIITALPD